MDVPSERRLYRRIARVRERIAAACARASRPPDATRLVAVTKAVPLDVITVALAAGLTDFGENRANELAEKAPVVQATWHYLGKLQRGTAARVADHADMIHSAEPGHGLERMARRAAECGIEIPCLVEVDLTGRQHGVGPEDLAPFVDESAVLDGIRLVGLMTIPPMQPDPEDARPYFCHLRELRDQVRSSHPELCELSMGMSADYAIAVEEGATMVRVGRALFGARPGPARP